MLTRAKTPDDPEQSRRFIEAARAAGADEKPDASDRDRHRNSVSLSDPGLRPEKPWRKPEPMGAPKTRSVMRFFNVWCQRSILPYVWGW